MKQMPLYGEVEGKKKLPVNRITIEEILGDE